jgi:hypothetical protein
MKIGMLWFDDSEQRGLSARIERAARHYEAKYGIYPTVCYIHPSMLPMGEGIMCGMEIRASNMILPNHYWIGLEQDQKVGHKPAA